MPRASLLPLIVCLALACSPTDEADTPPEGCAEGSGASCEPFSAPECPVGKLIVFGEGECKPIGWQVECSKGSDDEAEPGVESACCPVSFEPDPSGWGCREVLPESECPAGTMARLGSHECEPVGWNGCPASFEPDPSGWGCRDISTADDCTGATRAALGATTCLPVGDCSAAFPPGNATLFVDDDYGPGDLDSTHFATIGEAIAAATAVDVIAVYAGAYSEVLSVVQPVTIVGRCAKQVIVDGDGMFSPGIWAYGGTLSLRGVTLRNHGVGVLVQSAAQVSLQDVVIEGARSIGIRASEPGASILLSGSVVRDTLAEEFEFQAGVGVQAEYGATATITDSDLSGNASSGVFAYGGSTIAIQRSIVADNQSVGGTFGAVQVGESSTVTVHESAFVGNVMFAAYIAGMGARLELTDSVVRDTKPQQPSDNQYGLYVSYGAQLVANRSSLYDRLTAADVEANPNLVPGSKPTLWVDGGGIADISSSVVWGLPLLYPSSSMMMNGVALLMPTFGGSGLGCYMKLERTLIRGDLALPLQGPTWGVRCGEGATLDVVDSTIERMPGAGIVVDQSSFASVRGTLVRGVYEGLPGLNGVVTTTRAVAVTNTSQLVLSDSALIDNQEYGLYVSACAGGGPEAPGVTATNLVVRNTLPGAAPGSGPGAGVGVGAGSNVLLAGAALSDNAGAGLLVADIAANVTGTNVVVLRTGGGDVDPVGRGVWARAGARVTLDSSALIGNLGAAAFVSDFGTQLSLVRTLVGETRGAGEDGTARGIVVEAGGYLDLSNSSVLRGEEIGIQVVGVGSSAKLAQAMLGQTTARGVDGAFGHEAVAQDGGILTAERVRVFGAAGPALAFFGGTGKIETCILDHNPVAVHVQDGSVVVDTPGDAPGEVFVSPNTYFIANELEVGSSSVLPVPTILGQ